MTHIIHAILNNLYEHNLITTNDIEYIFNNELLNILKSNYIKGNRDEFSMYNESFIHILFLGITEYTPDEYVYLTAPLGFDILGDSITFINEEINHRNEYYNHISSSKNTLINKILLEQEKSLFFTDIHTTLYYRSNIDILVEPYIKKKFNICKLHTNDFDRIKFIDRLNTHKDISLNKIKKLKSLQYMIKSTRK